MSNKKSIIQIRTEDAIRKQKEESRKLRIEALVWLVKEFPNAFDTNERINPLKLGIREDILAYAEKNPPLDRRGNPISRSKLREAVAMFTHRLDYLICVKAGKSARIDLEGNVVGNVTEKEAESAAESIKKRIEKAIRKSRKTMAQTVTSTPSAQSRPNHHSHSSRYPGNQGNNYQRSNNYDNRSGQSSHAHYNNNNNYNGNRHGNHYPSDRNHERYVGQYRDNQRDLNNNMMVDDHSMMTHHQVNRSQNVQVRHRSGSKQYDPKAVARLKEKLRISRNTNEEPID